MPAYGRFNGGVIEDVAADDPQPRVIYSQRLRIASERRDSEAALERLRDELTARSSGRTEDEYAARRAFRNRPAASGRRSNAAPCERRRQHTRIYEKNQ